MARMSAAREDVYSRLFEKIVQGEYTTGTRLKEDELAGEFDISRTTIRAALRQLAQDGLLELAPNKGARVVGFTVDDIEEIYDIRKSLETLALTTAVPRISIDGLLQLRAEFVASADDPDPLKHEALDARLHDFIARASGKRRLVQIINQLGRLVREHRDLGFRNPEVRSEALESHLKLIDALCVRDLGRAVELMEEHLDGAKRNWVRLVAARHGAGVMPEGRR